MKETVLLRITNLWIRMEQDQKFEYDLITRPETGTALAVASAISFFFLCMILPLVGPAGVKMEQAGTNKSAFVAVLLVTLVLAAFSTWSKLGRRKVDGSALPVYSFALCVICVISFVLVQFNGFAI